MLDVRWVKTLGGRLHELDIAIFDLIAHDKKSLQAGIDVQPINSHRMVVIEKHCRVLPARIVIQQRVAGCDPVLGITIAGSGCAPAVKVNDTANLRLISLRTAEVVVNGKKVFLRKPVLPFDE